MRLNTMNRYTYFRYLYLVLVLAIGFDVLLNQIPGSTSFDTPYISGVVFFITALLIYRGNPVFKYDSDGEVLILDSKEPILGSIFSSNKLYEFPKRKLLGYRISKLPLRKSLILKIQSKEAKYKTLRINISYLTASETRHLSRSLDSVAKANKNVNHNSDDD